MSFVFIIRVIVQCQTISNKFWLKLGNFEKAFKMLTLKLILIELSVIDFFLIFTI